jgi:hypothetical protein
MSTGCEVEELDESALASRFRPIQPPVSTTRATTFSGSAMQKTKTSAERERAQYAELHGQYRAIGPAAIIAALLHAKKRKTPVGGKAA